MPGASARESVVGQALVAMYIVEPGHTAEAFSNAGVVVLGTPALVGFVEETCLRAIQPFLQPGEASVGVHVDLRHLRPTPIGAEVFVKVRVESVDGDRVQFGFDASDAGGIVATGRHTRHCIDLARFMRGANRRAPGTAADL